MASTQLIAPTTAATTNKSVKYMASAHDVCFTAVGLAGAETIVPYVGGPSGWTALFDSTGTQIKLTATKPQLVLPGGGSHYAFDKDATAGAAGLDVTAVHGAA